MSLQATCGSCRLPISDHGDVPTDAVIQAHELIAIHQDYLKEAQERMAQRMLEAFETSSRPNFFMRLLGRNVSK